MTGKEAVWRRARSVLVSLSRTGLLVGVEAG